MINVYAKKPSGTQLLACICFYAFCSDTATSPLLQKICNLINHKDIFFSLKFMHTLLTKMTSKITCLCHKRSNLDKTGQIISIHLQLLLEFSKYCVNRWLKKVEWLGYSSNTRSRFLLAQGNQGEVLARFINSDGALWCLWDIELDHRGSGVGTWSHLTFQHTTWVAPSHIKGHLLTLI